MRFRPLLLVIVVSLVVGQHPAKSQQAGEILDRENDETARTADSRRNALSILLEGAQQAAKAGNQTKAARFFNRAGRLQLRLSLPQEALTTYHEALAVSQSDVATKIDTLNGIGATHTHLGKCEEAQAALKESLSLSEQTDNVPGKAETLLIMSDCVNRTDHALALRTAQDSLVLWSSVNHRWGMGKAHSAIGQYQFTLQNLAEASQHHEAALRIWRELNIRDEEAEALINLGYIEYRKGGWQNSISFLTQAQGLIDEADHPYKAGQVTIGVGEAFLESGLPEAALAQFQRAAEYFQRSQDPLAVAVVGWDTGKAYYALGDYAQAVATFERTIQDAESIHEPKLVAVCNEFLGQTYLVQNDAAKSLAHLQTALGLFEKIGSRMEPARIYARIAQVHEQEQQYQTARDYYQRALDTFRALSDRLNESATLFALGRLELKQNNLVLAEELLKRSIEVTENIRRVSTSSDLAAGFSATIHDRYESYIDCLMRQHKLRPDAGLAVRAFELSEQSRARSLAELLHAMQTNLTPGVDPQLAEQEKLLRQKLRVKEDYKVSLLGRAHKQEELQGLEQQLVQLSEQYEQVRGQIRQRFPAFDLVTRPTGWSLKDIQEKVIADDQTLLLEYSLGADKSFVWAVSRNSFASYELPPRNQIVSAVKNLRKHLVSPGVASGEQDAAIATGELSQLVLTTVAPELQKQRIIVIADGVLNYIPFQVLLVPGTNLPLVANFEVVTAPSATILGELRQEAAQRQPSKTLVAFGDPVFSSSHAQNKTTETGNTSGAAALRDIELSGERFDPSVVKRLFYAKRELANLQEATGRGDSLMATDFGATRDKLLSTDLTPYAILHFATHGFLDPKRPERSGLVLSTVDRDGKDLNGFVSLEDIYQLRAPVDLVVLSACQTGLGKDVRGEGLLGLTRGFMYAGAASVVASLWKVDDESTAELMKQFYANLLQKGMTPAAALREAQNNIRQRPGWSAPYYWAAFTLQGEYRQVIKPLSPQSNYWRAITLGTLLLILLVTAGWYVRKRYFTVKK
ncbi:MAG TPA: CHAT domain-containing protein [Pyrinomonadaceae bacterium]|nr:CHAT domain-containing protein [Pyrinomonadaceae bacterium]